MELGIKTFQFRNLVNPYEDMGRGSYVAVVEARDLPIGLSEWRKINPRDPNRRSSISRAIRDTIAVQPEMFYFQNRGLVLLAKAVHYNTKDSVAVIQLIDKSKHGLLDGGHTFTVVKDAERDVPEDQWVPIYLTVHIMTGFDDIDDIVDIVEARNTSRVVRPEGLENMKERFEPIKQIIAGQSYHDLVAYKENELDEDDTAKPIPIGELLSYLVCFDVDHFDDSNHPKRAYGARREVLQHYLSNFERMEKLCALLPDILRLRDHIYLELPEAYNRVGGSGESGRGLFGRVTGVKFLSQKLTLEFSGSTSQYQIPASFIYPLLASLRVFVVNRAGHYQWTHDPFEMFSKYKYEVVKRLGKRIAEIKDPRKLGRDESTWDMCYLVMRTAML